VSAQVQVVLIAAGCSGAVGTVGIGAIWLLRRASLRLSLMAADGGAGLGLAIVRGIALAHHGQVSVVNTGVGCRFEIRLPALVTDCDDAAGGYVGAGRSAEVPIPSL
jgi:hypothetical protein